jgi:hypothetical protein
MRLISIVTDSSLDSSLYCDLDSSRLISVVISIYETHFYRDGPVGDLVDEILEVLTLDEVVSFCRPGSSSAVSIFTT